MRVVKLVDEKAAWRDDWRVASWVVTTVDVRVVRMVVSWVEMRVASRGMKKGLK